MRNTIVAILVLVAANSFAVFSQKMSEANCIYSTKVRITAQQIQKDPPAYVFLVTNLTDSPIHTVILGRGKEPQLREFVVWIAFRNRKGELDRPSIDPEAKGIRRARPARPYAP